MQISRVCVCGAGTMGSGIAQVLAQHGFYTLLYDPFKNALEKARGLVENSLSNLVTREKISAEEKNMIYRRISFVDDLQLCQADVFIEAIVEDPVLKAGLFNQLAELNHSEAVFATNTSSLSVTLIAEKIKNPQRVAGMHFFNPPTIMKLVELVQTKYTNDYSIQLLLQLAKDIGKVPVLCRDSPGFIVNRVARPFYIESLRIAEGSKNSIAVIDKAMEAGGFKMGPFRLMDLIGNDVNYAVSCSVYDQLGKPERLKPSYLQEEKVREGKLGKKTGEGYYRY